MKEGALAVWAEQMRVTLLGLEPPAALWRQLSRGLIVVLERKDERRWRLALGRTDVHPSLQEVGICRQAFGVPLGTELLLRTEQRPANRGPRGCYYITELFWSEDETSAAAVVAGPALVADGVAGVVGQG